MLKTRSTTLALAVMLIAAPASANVITDWDATGVALIQGNAPAPPPRVGGPTGGVRTMSHLWGASWGSGSWTSLGG